MTKMNPGVQRALEQEIENAIAETLANTDLKLPLRAPKRTMHLMAKAAVTVYEAVAEQPPKE